MIFREPRFYVDYVGIPHRVWRASLIYRDKKQNRANKLPQQVLQDSGVLETGFFYDKDATLIDSLVDEEVSLP